MALRETDPKSYITDHTLVYEDTPVEGVPSSLGSVPARFRGGLVSKAHRFVYHSTLGSRVIKKNECVSV